MRFGLLLTIALSTAAIASDLPADASVKNGKTMVPKVVVDSGRLEWEPHTRDLIRWPTLSYLDHRPNSEPRRLEMKPPIAGDAAHGKELAGMWCVTCHALPGDAWPGTVGSSMLHYQQFKHPDNLVFQQIYDPRVFNPNSVMPPFGTAGLLTEQEIRDLVVYLQSIE
jgi:sulfur-oxidizing protein SoxA